MISVYRLAAYRLGRPHAESLTGEDHLRAGLALLGGCADCGATLASYNAYPTRSGYWCCAFCAEQSGDAFRSAAEADRYIFGEDAKSCTFEEPIMSTQRIPMSAIVAEYGPGPRRHYFDPATMRWFGCRLPRHGYRGPGGTYFITSERDTTSFGAWGGERRYTIRRLVGPGQIETIGEFGDYGSNEYEAAHRDARRLAEGTS